MRVLWLSVTPSMFDEKKFGGWIASLEKIVHKYLKDKIDLGIVFDYNSNDFKVEKNGTTYYPINSQKNYISSLKYGLSIKWRWQLLRPLLLRAIDDFKPDVIQCFGSEWPFGAIVNEVSVPVVIHMQGFLNIYNLSISMAYNAREEFVVNHLNPFLMIRKSFDLKFMEKSSAFEREIMQNNRYFMGRTEWDKNIVKYFSPGSKYFMVNEAIRPEIYESSKAWEYSKKPKIRLITITQAGYLKGNEIILRTAKILKELIHVDFEWRVAGNKTVFVKFEKKTGIKSQDVDINLLGLINADCIVDELTSADFYIHPAIIDNSPNSLCEAQLIGCPIIAANVGGIPQLVKDGETGFLYPYNEPYALAFLICNLINNGELLNQVSTKEQEVAHMRHNPQTIADSVYQTYEKILLDYENKK